ncbi:MAG: DNA polymerase III subunit delta [Pyrinomonadaceae bacterium]
MTSIPAATLSRSLSDGRIKPLYLLLGTERYLRTAAAKEITEAALANTLLREFNETTFSLFSETVHAAIAAAEQMPMMSERRVVVVKDFGKLPEDDEESLIRYVLNPVASTVMILVADDLDKRKKATKTLLDECTVVQFAPLRDGDAKQWAKKLLQGLKVALDEPTLTEIIRLVGTDVQTLANELDKLATAAIDTGRITAADVDELVGRSRELSNFELGDQLLAGNRKRALEAVYRLLEDGAEPVMLIGAIAGVFHRLALGKQLLARGGPDDVFHSIGMPPFKRAAYISTLRGSDEDRLSIAIQRIAAADLAIKTSQASSRQQLELLVCDLTR